MSRKRKKRAIVPQEQAKSTLADALYTSLAKDGFVNSLAYLGEASPLSQANDFVRHSISNDYNLLTVMYRENWLAARIIDTPCEDMTRTWYSLSSELDQQKLDELAKLEAKHNVKQEITNAIRWGRLYGGAAAVMVIKGQEDMLDEPIDYDMLQPGCFRGLIVIDRVRGIFPSLELEEDMDDPEFGYPKWYQVTLNEESGEIIRIHHSRLLLFRGRQLPIDEEIEADYWGASELEHVYEELQKRNSSSANIAQLIFQANVSALKIADYGEVMGMGTAQQREQVYRYVQEMNRLKTSFGITLMGNEDNYEQHPYSFAGVAEVYETFMMDMAGAAEIPATKLFGRAPQGMNATGESDMKNYYEMINQLQERIVKPALEKLLPVMCMSLWGEVPEDMEIVFEPLGTTTPAERAEIMGQITDPIINAYSAGLISQKVALMELRESGKPINAWTNISDEDIENAEDEPEQGEEMANPMGMPPGMPGMPGETQAGLESGQETQAQPEVDMDKVHELKERVRSLRETQAGLEPEEETQGELDMDKVHELKERIQKLRGEELGDGGDIQVGLEYGDDPQVEQESDAERAKKLKERVKRLRETQVQLESGEKTQAEPEKSRIQRLRERIRRLRHPDWKSQVVDMARKGDFDGARAIIAKQRKKAENGNFLLDALAFLRKETDGGPGSGNHGHAGRPGKKGGSAPNNGGGGRASSETKARSGPMPSSGVFGNVSERKRYKDLREKAIKRWGTTTNRGSAGYLLPSGEMLDFKRWQSGSQGHRKIDELYEGKKTGTEAMLDFMGGGNIRMMPEAPGLCIIEGAPLTKQQEEILEEYIDSAGYDSHRFYLDVLRPDGSVAYSKIYKRFEFNNPANVLRDVRDYSKPSTVEEIEDTTEEEPIDNSTQTAYNGHATKGWAGLNAAMKVGGPKGAKRFIRDYFRKNPDVAQQATKYMDVRRKVQDFLKDHPNAENFNTYDAETGEVKNIENGFCVTFHQNNTPDDPLGGYSDEDYAALCAIAAHELGADGVNIGYYGNPEVSFVCQDEAAAKRFAVEHNQQSIYNASTGRTLKNRQYKEKLNPIRL